MPQYVKSAHCAVKNNNKEMCNTQNYANLKIFNRICIFTLYRTQKKKGNSQPQNTHMSYCSFFLDWEIPVPRISYASLAKPECA